MKARLLRDPDLEVLDAAGVPAHFPLRGGHELIAIAEMVEAAGIEPDAEPPKSSEDKDSEE
jgi:hypothetical protein